MAAISSIGMRSIEFCNGLSEASVTHALPAGAQIGRVAVVYLESPANPTNVMIDFAAVLRAVATFESVTGQRPLVVCDNTMLGPVFQRPLENGFDLAVYSLTNYIGGHSDLVAGSVVGRKELLQKVRRTCGALGTQLDPYSSWLIGRSLETLFLRMDRSAKSGRTVADWLARNPYCSVEIYHPDYVDDVAYKAVYARQCSGPGTTFSFVVDGGRERTFKLINALNVFKRAASLGGTELLVCHPASTTHPGMSREERKIAGVTEGLICISVGLEHPDDLVADLNNAFATAFGS